MALRQSLTRSRARPGPGARDGRCGDDAAACGRRAERPSAATARAHCGHRAGLSTRHGETWPGRASPGGARHKFRWMVPARALLWLPSMASGAGPRNERASVARLSFDRGTLLIEGVDSSTAQPLPGVIWDPRVGAQCAPACKYRDIVHVLEQQGHAFLDHRRRDARRARARSTHPQAAASTPRKARHRLRARHSRDERDSARQQEDKRTPEYLAQKLARLRQARLPNFILCVDEQRNCSEGELPPGARVIRYRRRVPAGLVLEQLARSDAVGTPGCPGAAEHDRW